jgi:hypothetical protein
VQEEVDLGADRPDRASTRARDPRGLAFLGIGGGLVDWVPRFAKTPHGTIGF